MDIPPGPRRCAACARILTTIDDVQVCVLCSRVFCSQHIAVRKGVSNCGGCEEQRRTLEQAGVPDADHARIVNLLCRDLEHTVGAGHERVVEEAAARIRLFSDDAADFEQRVVDEVQQELHDSFVDTSWPRCPAHPHHPLWYSAPCWVCDKTGSVFAQLGTLSYGGGKHAGS
jgi:hypothetical protein